VSADQTSAMGLPPRILFIDDNIDSVATAGFAGRADVAVLHPGEVELKDLEWADAILVDLRLTDWPERDRLTSVALQPPDGLALTAVLRARLDDESRPVAFALLSAELKDVYAGLSPTNHEHAIARALNLEWVYRKGIAAGNSDPSKIDRSDFVTSVVSLANAVSRLPIPWPSPLDPAVDETVEQLLGIPRPVLAKWQTRATATVLECHPPRHELAFATHGLSFLRWLLHRILPYPTFLLSVPYAAARLRVTPASFARAWSTSRQFRELLEPSRYSGILHDFDGMKWWRAGLDALIWDLTDGNPFDAGMLGEALRKASPELALASAPFPVVVLNDEYVPLDRLADIDESVEIQPDDWPSFAAVARVKKGDADEKELSQLIVEPDTTQPLSPSTKKRRAPRKGR
jgi:hypothetical protein